MASLREQRCWQCRAMYLTLTAEYTEDDEVAYPTNPKVFCIRCMDRWNRYGTMSNEEVNAVDPTYLSDGPKWLI